MNLFDFESYLNTLYQVSEFKDYCPKGLTVEGSHHVHRGISGVSFGLDLLDVAIQRQVDFIIVHHLHGFWDNQSRIVRGSLKRKIEGLISNNISLFGYHLPMDAHPTLGNNIGAINAVGAKHTEGFIRQGNRDIGFIGEYDSPISIDEFMVRVSHNIGAINFEFLNGKSLISKIGVCTGASPSSVEELVARGDIDLFLTGEARENTKQYCEEEGIHFVAAGHHQTERFGPKSIAQHISAELGIQTEFVDLANPV